jgi:hypothetical protein
MAVVDDDPDHARIALRDPAQGEEGGADAMALEQGQDAFHVGLHPAGPAFPVPRGMVCSKAPTWK